MVDRDLEMLEQFYEDFLHKYVETMRKEAFAMEHYGVRAEAMVGTVANQILKSVQACKETTVKLNEYGRFLGELEDEV